MKKIINKRSTLNTYGFTITEVLVTIIISLLVLMIMSSTFVLNQRIFRTVDATAELLQNARIVSDLMSREIRQATEIVTVLPPDNSDPNTIAHELQFEDGHIDTQIQYIRYYISGTDLKRQIIVYYFTSAPSVYVQWDDTDAFGTPEQLVLDERFIGEFFSAIDFYGTEKITIDTNLIKNTENIELRSEIYPRNI